MHLHPTLHLAMCGTVFFFLVPFWGVALRSDDGPGRSMTRPNVNVCVMQIRGVP